MFDPKILAAAAAIIAAGAKAKLQIATAESCTGGLVSAALTAIPGSSSVLERGFVTYSNESKVQLLGVDRALIDNHGAVSAQVAQAMVEGVFRHSPADIAVAITGIAGPGGGSAQKPVGLVFIGCGARGRDSLVARHVFTGRTREGVRDAALREALSMLQIALFQRIT